MLSICIPVYRSDPRQMVEALHAQAQALSIPIEILVLDDASGDSWLPAFKAVEAFATVVHLPENLGRARIRNAFVSYAKYQHMLFLDGDVGIPEGFLARWTDYLLAHPESRVCCGGKVCGPRPTGSRQLRWKYANTRETQPAAIRQLHPHQSFITGNFLIQAMVFHHVKFHEQLIGYGHEDTLFGYELKQHGIQVSHLDNPIRLEDYDTAAAFIDKTRESIHSLMQVLEIVQYDKAFIQEIRLLRAYEQLLRSPFYRLLRCSGGLIARFCKFLLINGIHSLILLDIYKIFYLNRNKCGLFKA